VRIFGISNNRPPATDARNPADPSAKVLVIASIKPWKLQ